jgi:acyl carrier protein
MADLNRELRQVVAATFGLAESAVGDDASRATVAAWDSLGQISLVLALEERFGVAIAVEDIAGLTSVAAVRETLVRLTGRSA